MKVESRERNGFSAVLVGDKWVRVSNHPDKRYHGRQSGEEVYSVEVEDGTPTASFYRSNSGKETVNIAPDGVNFTEEFYSYEDARYWAKDNAIAEKASPFDKALAVLKAQSNAADAKTTLAKFAEAILSDLHPQGKVSVKVTADAIVVEQLDSSFKDVIQLR